MKQRHPGAFAGATFAGAFARPEIAAFAGAKDAKVAATVSALVGRSVLISLVPSVAEADVATVDGLESTTKSTRDRKR
ncbi:hypothetical protein BHM03_00062603 [Ensete ventricosum]|nr:hypothetical protein BHM03_00062603 [Ensete ventricosum]